ncbi:hypothetical protein [Nonlabens antarcticus]|uniref:hypothetical protein n=1 Tax=Nonlabens antarcticus TaxID=392714 RepID=UPI00189155CE|nr:hypothetical protein [Nonlabens antarcticus]
MKYALSIFLLLVMSTISLSQTYNDDKDLINQNTSTSSNEQINIVQNQTFFKTDTRRLPPTGNSVFIEQVGFNNTGSVAITSNQSDVNLLQIGSNNEAFINLRAGIIRENVAQIGNDNLFRDYSLHGAQLHTADIIQNGSYNEIISVGRNSLSEQIKVTQSGIGKQAYIIHN